MSTNDGKNHQLLVCPNCSSLLELYDHHGIHIDQCNKCGGVWFDGNELSTFVQTSSDIGVLNDGDLSHNEKGSFLVTHEPAKSCPRCQTDLNEYNYAYNSNIYIDRCKQCNGVWLDGWELENFARYLNKSKDQLTVGNFILKKHINIEQWKEFQKTLTALKKRLTVWQRFLFYYFPPAINGWLIKELHSSRYIYVFNIIAVSLIVILAVTLLIVLLM